MRLTNPFADPTKAQREDLSRQRAEAAAVRQRAEKLAATYRQLVDDPRYLSIKEELALSLGECLVQLLHQAEACGTCAPYAVRVRSLHDIVMRPLSQVFIEAHRSRVEPVPEPNVV